jgi:hypothetical protein
VTEAPPGPPAPQVWLVTGGSATTPGTNFLGTTDSQALELKVSNTRAPRIEPTGDTPNIIGGFSGNQASGAVGATIAGGGTSGFGSGSNSPNRVTSSFGTVGAEKPGRGQIAERARGTASLSEGRRAGSRRRPRRPEPVAASQRLRFCPAATQRPSQLTFSSPRSSAR